jgi:hypothetical protein
MGMSLYFLSVGLWASSTLMGDELETCGENVRYSAL